MSKIKLSTHIHPSEVNNKSIEIKHDICSKLHVMFENYMVSTKFTYALFQRQETLKSSSQVVHKKAVLKDFANFTGAYGYRSPFLSSCWNTACNFIENDSPIQVFCCEFYEISQNSFTQNNCQRLLLNGKSCC